MANGMQSSGINILKARLRLLKRPTAWLSVTVMGVALVTLNSYWRSLDRPAAESLPNLSDLQSGNSADNLPPPEDNSIAADIDNVELLLSELSDQQTDTETSLPSDWANAADSPPLEEAITETDGPTLPDRFIAPSIFDPSAIASSLSTNDAAIANSSPQPLIPGWAEAPSTTDPFLSRGSLFAPLNAADGLAQPWTPWLATESSSPIASPTMDAASLQSLRFPLQEFIEAADTAPPKTDEAAIAADDSATSATLAQETSAPASPLLQGLPYPYWGGAAPSATAAPPLLSPLPGTTGYQVPPSLADLQRQSASGNPTTSASPTGNSSLVPAPALPSSFIPTGVPSASPYVPPTVTPTPGLTDSFQVNPTAPTLPTTSEATTPAPYSGGGRNGRINTFSNP